MTPGFTKQCLGPFTETRCVQIQSNFAITYQAYKLEENADDTDMITNICLRLTWLPGVLEGGPWTVVGEDTGRPVRLLTRDIETPESRLETTGSCLEASASMFEGSAFRMGASFSRQEPSGPRLEAGPRARLWEAVV